MRLEKFYKDIKMFFVFPMWTPMSEMIWTRSETFLNNQDQYESVLTTYLAVTAVMTVRDRLKSDSTIHIWNHFTQKCIRKGKDYYLLPLNFWTIAFVSCFTDDRLLVFAPSLSRIETWLLLIDLRYSKINI